MENKRKVRGIIGIDDQVWRKFAALAKIHGLRQSELFEQMVLNWEKHQKSVVKVEGNNKKASDKTEA
jgi:hypothetical protein